MTGTTVETVNRVLTRFRRLGLVQSGRRWLMLKNLEGLAALAEGESFA